MNALDKKILSVFGDRVILKPLTRWNEAYKEFPRYVMEYLVAKYVNPNNPVIGQKKIDRIINEHYVESGEKELIKSKIKELGEYILLGQLQARLDASKDHYWVEVPALGDNYVRINMKVLKEFADALLGAGAWGTMTVQYDPKYQIRRRIYPFYIFEFTPFQVTRLNLDDYIEKRAQFSTDEWRDLLVQTIGFNPERYREREKQLLLLRLVPFVEANYNMIELGPRETGKTYTYRNTSSKSFVISGGKTTPATLFYNKATRKLGILGQKELVFFDEIANTSFSDPDATTSILKDYMQTGKFTRGSQEFSAQASIVLAGNIEVDLEKRTPTGAYEHLFAILPQELQDVAFLDRIHCFLPGWEVPKIVPENYAAGYGFITDYLAEIFSRFRRRNYQMIVDAHVDFGRMTGRNQDALKKTAAGLLKLLFPHRTIETVTNEELTMCLELAIECRQRILDQLAIISPGEFRGVNLRKHLRIQGGLALHPDLKEAAQAHRIQMFKEIEVFERQLRKFIEKELRANFSDAWLKTAVPVEIRQRWQDRREDDLKEGRQPEESLISYSDFSDYEPIIVRNWKNVFGKFFKNKEKLQNYLRDLNNLCRKTTMHARTITEDEIGHGKVLIRWIQSRISPLHERE